MWVLDGVSVFVDVCFCSVNWDNRLCICAFVFQCFLLVTVSAMLSGKHNNSTHKKTAGPKNSVALLLPFYGDAMQSCIFLENVQVA